MTETLPEATLRAHLEQGLLVGAAVGVYRNGELWKDLCIGSVDPGGPPVTTDTPFILFSNSKPLASSCLHWLHSQGAFEWDDPVTRFWPEFGQHGKGRVTIRHLLSHQGGFPHTPPELTLERMKDWEESVRIIERMSCDFPPGQGVYHGLTIGFAIGELVQRLDSRPVAEVFRDQVALSLGLSRTSLGSPDLSAASPDVHNLVPLDSPEREHRTPFIRDPEMAERGILDTELIPAINDPSVRAACIPAITAVASARDLARFYAMYLAGGTLDGVEVLKPETVEEVLRVQVEGIDPVLAETYGEAFAYRGRTLGMCTWLPNSPIIGHAGGGITFCWLNRKHRQTGPRDSLTRRSRAPAPPTQATSERRDGEPGSRGAVAGGSALRRVVASDHGDRDTGSHTDDHDGANHHPEAGSLHEAVSFILRLRAGGDHRGRHTQGWGRRRRQWLQGDLERLTSAALEAHLAERGSELVVGDTQRVCSGIQPQSAFEAGGGKESPVHVEKGVQRGDRESELGDRFLEQVSQALAALLGRVVVADFGKLVVAVKLHQPVDRSVEAVKSVGDVVGSARPRNQNCGTTKRRERLAPAL
jgi:CubicO group peptidase (beta-lactamase class C family)